MQFKEASKGKRTPKTVPWLLAVTLLFCIVQYNNDFDFLLGSDQRYMAVMLKSVSETVEGMPEKPQNMKGKSYPTCDEELEYLLERDKFFASLTPNTTPHPFPVDTFPIEVITEHQCLELSNLGEQRSMQTSDIASVLFHIEVENDVEMVQRTMNRLMFRDNHGFVLHVGADISKEITDSLVKLAEETNESTVCVVRGGYLKFLSSNDIRVIFSSMRWLKSFAPYWDFFISLSGSDYSLMDGPTLNNELISQGPVSWTNEKKQPLGDESKNVYKFSHSERFLEYGLTCEETKRTVQEGGRSFWLQELVREIRIGWMNPLTSGGIWHRSMVDFLIEDDRARAAYMYFLLFPCAGAEHYWHSLYTLPELEPMLVSKDPAIMSWHEGRNTDGIHNSFITMDMWDSHVAPAIENRIPFIRSFDSKKEKEVLDKIDEYSAEYFAVKYEPVASTHVIENKDSTIAHESLNEPQDSNDEKGDDEYYDSIDEPDFDEDEYIEAKNKDNGKSLTLTDETDKKFEVETMVQNRGEPSLVIPIVKDMNEFVALTDKTDTNFDQVELAAPNGGEPIVVKLLDDDMSDPLTLTDESDNKLDQVEPMAPNEGEPIAQSMAEDASESLTLTDESDNKLDQVEPMAPNEGATTEYYKEEVKHFLESKEDPETHATNMNTKRVVETETKKLKRKSNRKVKFLDNNHL